MLPQDLVTRSYVIQDLASGLNPIVNPQPEDPTLPPPSISGGADVRDAVYFVVSFLKRENPFFRTARLVFDPDTFDPSYAGTAAIIIDGVTSSVVGPFASLDDLLDDLAQEVQSRSGATVTAIATDEDGDGVIETLKIEGLSTSDYDVDFLVDSPLQATCTADAVSFNASIYGRCKDSGENAPEGRQDIKVKRKGWGILNKPSTVQFTNYAITFNTHTAPFPAGHLAAVYVYVSNVTGANTDGAGVIQSYAATVRTLSSVGTVSG